MTAWVTFRVPVPESYVRELEDRGREQGGTGVPALGGADAVTVAGHDFGEWSVQSVEYGFIAQEGWQAPGYWVTFGREVS